MPHSDDARRHDDGAIDYAFYRARAARLRTEAVRRLPERIAQALAIIKAPAAAAISAVLAAAAPARRA